MPLPKPMQDLLSLPTASYVETAVMVKDTLEEEMADASEALHQTQSQSRWD